MEKEIRQEGDYTITEGIHGDTYHHPSFGMLSFSRAHGGHSNLFGSSIQHRDTIHMVLKEGTVSRDLNEDWYFGGPEIVEVEMSQSQFAELITSMNMGSGVPCTIKFIKGHLNRRMPYVLGGIVVTASFHSRYAYHEGMPYPTIWLIGMGSGNVSRKSATT